MKKIKSVLIFENGNVAVFDEGGNQVLSLQGGFYDYKYASKLAKAIVRDNPEVQEQKHFFPLHDYIKFYKENKKKYGK